MALEYLAVCNGELTQSPLVDTMLVLLGIAQDEDIVAVERACADL